MLEVTDTEPGVKGDTVSNVTKPATLETGAVIQVPLFVNVGDKIKLDPSEKRYIQRADPPKPLERRVRDPRRDPAPPPQSGQPISSPSAGSSYSCLHSTHRTHSEGIAIESRVSSRAMPRLVDTTIRVLSQEPLAGLMPTADLLRLAELLDGAGFAYLEVSGGGVFDTAVRRGVESPWERIRALKARTTTPLALALRGRFLVGSRPVGRDFARRFVA